MNKAQETHVKAMARKIETHAEAIVLRMQAIQRNSLADMPVDLITANFKEVTHYCVAMHNVLSDMLPSLPPAPGGAADPGAEVGKPYVCSECSKRLAFPETFWFQDLTYCSEHLPGYSKESEQW